MSSVAGSASAPSRRRSRQVAITPPSSPPPPSGATIADGTGLVTILDNDGALTASAAAPAPTGIALTAAELDLAVAEAEAGWLRARPDADFGAVVVRVGELDGLLLGVAEGTLVTIDATAAGWGWTVGGGAMDLLAVVAHELGHALGLAHMDGTTASMMAGVVRTPELTAFDRVAGALLYSRLPGTRADDRES